MRLILCLSLMLFSMTTYADIKTIRFATEATYPPFEYYDANGQMQGFDIDVANALCAALKAQCTIANQAFSGLIPSLQIGKFDAVIAALGITEERAKEVNFTASYYEPTASFVANKAKNLSLATITSKTIGVQGGSTFESYLEDKYADKVQIKLYASVQDAFLDLKANRLDAVLADTPIAYAWLKEDGNNVKYGVIDKPIVDHTYFGAGFGIAVSKTNSALLSALNQALNTIKANGTYEKIFKKYFA